MRTLVTGGAGFIGSAIVDQLVEAGHEVVVIDALLPAAHHHRPDYLNPAGHLPLRRPARPRRRRGRAPPGVEAVCHQAAMVGLGVDFARRGRLRRPQRPGHRGAAAGPARPRASGGRLVLASSMVVYGEGRYRCAESTGSCARRRGSWPTSRPAASTPAAPTAAATSCRRRCPRSAPTDPRNVYAATKLHQEHLGASYAREHDGGGDRPAVPQRVRTSDAPRHPLRRRRQHLPIRGRPRGGTEGLRGRGPAPRLRARARRGPGQPGRARGRPRGPRRVQRRAAAHRTPCSTWPAP